MKSVGGFLFTWLFMPLACLAAGFAGGWKVHDWKDANGQVKATQHVVAIVQRQGQINTTAAVQQQAAADRIRTVTKTILKEVPVYVSPATDVAYPLPVGLVRLHDAAALDVDVSVVRDPAARADDAPSGVTPSDFAATVAANYGDCLADSGQLGRLEAWLDNQLTLFNGGRTK